MFRVKITYRNMESSAALEKRIHHEAQKLYKRFQRILACDVVVSLPHRTKLQGKIIHININLYVPGRILAISHEPEINHAHEDAFVAVRDAFKSMEHKLTQFIEKRRSPISPHDFYVN